MKIAIIGSGISGLTCAYDLSKSKNNYDITVFEKNDYIGGHTHTVDIESTSGSYAIDTGFIVFNHQTYPNFTKLLSDISVETESTEMSFGVYSQKTNFQYAAGSLNSLFASRLNIINPVFYKLIFEIRRYHKLAHQILIQDHSHNPKSQFQKSQDFLQQHNFSSLFRDYYFYPLVSSLWSASDQHISDMPIYFIAKFMQNHALLKLIPDINWRIISGGSKSYILPMTKNFASKIMLNIAVKKIVRHTNGCFLYSENSELGQYDKVIIAAHSDQALSMLDQPTSLENEILNQFSYEENEVVLHTDEKQMPSLNRAWASWNYCIDRETQEKKQKAKLTYYMNRLQNIAAPENFFITLNSTQSIDPKKIIKHFSYSHPQYTLSSLAAQLRQTEINQQQNNTYFCGAYWGFGFHEDGVKSALGVCKEIQQYE